MRALIALACAWGCGVKAPPPEPPPGPTAIVIQWKVEAAADDRVDVVILVDDKPYDLGALAARAEDAVGPASCALAAAHSAATELVCGDGNSFVAQLEPGELVISLVDGARKSEVKRVPANGDGLVVRPLALPAHEPTRSLVR